MSWRVEVIADRTGNWCGNQMFFATKDEATDYGTNLSGRWTAVTSVRTVESDEPVNYRWIGGNVTGKAVAIEEAAK